VAGWAAAGSPYSGPAGRAAGSPYSGPAGRAIMAFAGA